MKATFLQRFAKQTDNRFTLLVLSSMTFSFFNARSLSIVAFAAAVRFARFSLADRLHVPLSIELLCTLEGMDYPVGSCKITDFSMALIYRIK